jgi:hypothetical protein
MLKTPTRAGQHRPKLVLNLFESALFIAIMDSAVMVWEGAPIEWVIGTAFSFFALPGLFVFYDAARHRHRLTPRIWARLWLASMLQLWVVEIMILALVLPLVLLEALFYLGWLVTLISVAFTCVSLFQSFVSGKQFEWNYAVFALTAVPTMLGATWLRGKLLDRQLSLHKTIKGIRTWIRQTSPRLEDESTENCPLTKTL